MFQLEPLKARKVRVGDVYGRLTILEIGRKSGSYRPLALVRCSCGSPPHLTRIDGLRNGSITGCGCVQRESATRHGLWDHPLYNVWRNMMKRCYDERSQRYSSYGGRGIAVCERWHDLRNFVADLAPKPDGMELDRIDNDADYSPGNCRWSTPLKQANNKRATHRITIDGRTQSAAEWARERGMRYNTILHRIKRGWSPVEAVTIPSRKSMATH